MSGPDESALRFFVAGAAEIEVRTGATDHDIAEQRLRHMGASPELSAAYDVLEEAGAATEALLVLCRAAELKGQNPAVFARHLVKLRSAVKGGGRA